jgi:hypothetical protein
MLKYLAGMVLVVSVTIVLTARWSQAVPQAAPRDAAGSGYQALADRFWTQWEAARPSEAVHSLSPDQGAWDNLGHLADDFQAATGGKCLGHSEVARKSMGSNMQYICFLAHYKPTPLRVEMLCYKADDIWTVIAFKINDSPQRWISEAGAVQLGAPADNNANNAGN